MLKTQAFHCPPEQLTLPDLFLFLLNTSCCFQAFLSFPHLFAAVLRARVQSLSPIRGLCSPALGSIPAAGRAPAAPSITRTGQHSPCGCLCVCVVWGVIHLSSCNMTHPVPAALFFPPVGRGRRTYASLYFCYENYTLTLVPEEGVWREGAEHPSRGVHQPHQGGKIQCPKKMDSYHAAQPEASSSLP